MMELLAPAGDMKSLEACVKAGADAVYLGLDALNARKGAKNFTPGELIEAANELHVRGMRLYVTVNTLVKDSEMDQLNYVSRALSDAGADAAIVQDLGVARFLRGALPSIELHASTQMAIHNRQGAKYLKNAGYSRAILAREATLDEIRACADTGIDIEVFGHGALCVSCSGQCLMSSLVGGRSGNRGMCAQPCRLNYSLGQFSGDLISPKDLRTIDFLGEIEKSGAKSLKLEGRLKSPEYVYAVVSAYRRALDGESVDSELLTRVFNRGYTKGYFFGADDAEIISDPDTEHVTNGEIEFEPREKKVKIRIKAEIVAGKPMTMEATDGTDTAKVQSEQASFAISAPLDAQAVSKQLTKTGATPFTAESFSCDLSHDAFARVSQLNALRRDCLDELARLRVKRHRGCGETVIAIPSAKDKVDLKSDRPILSVESSSPALLEIARENGADELVFAPFDVTDAGLDNSVTADCLAVPATLPGDDLERLNKWANGRGFSGTIISNPAHMDMTWPGRVRADWPMNIFNAMAVEAIDMPYAPSVELTVPEIAGLPGEKELIVYGRITVMRLRMCPIRAAGQFAGKHADCRACSDKRFLDCALIDRKGTAFPLFRVRTSAGCIIQVLNSVPLMLLRKNIRNLNAARWRVILTDEDEKTAAAIVRAHREVLSGKAFRDTADYDIIDSLKTTTGHYFRGVD